MPDYLVPPWTWCSREDFSLARLTRKSVASLRVSFADTACCFANHLVSYGVRGPNTNTMIVHNCGAT